MARKVGMRYQRSGRPISVSTVHGRLRNRLYAGSFEWLGEIYQGIHEPLVSADIWDAVQQTLDSRSATNVRAKPLFFPFTGLIRCGHCDCAVVAQMQKGKYIYYHCSGFRGKCPERYVRQEVLEEHFLDLLRKLRCGRQEFEDIRSDLEDVRSGDAFLSGQVTSLRHPHPLPGTPGALLRDGIGLLEMGRTAHLQLTHLPDKMKRQILDLVFQRCSWANGELTGHFNTPFDIFADYMAESAGRGRTSALMTKLSDALRHATPEIRLLVGRYNAMHRTRGVDLRANADDDRNFRSDSGFRRLAA